MKAQQTIFLFAVSILTALFVTHASAGILHEETITFKVYGNCEMCKKNIETALLKNQHIKKANWDVKTKMLTVVYDPHMMSTDNIHKLVANAGYDTDRIKAPDDAYRKLPACCQYQRPTEKTK